MGLTSVTTLTKPRSCYQKRKTAQFFDRDCNIKYTQSGNMNDEAAKLEEIQEKERERVNTIKIIILIFTYR